jgi:hypothetical protein
MVSLHTISKRNDALPLYNDFLYYLAFCLQLIFLNEKLNFLQYNIFKVKLTAQDLISGEVT